MAAFESTVYAERRAILDERMRQQGVDVLFCPPSGDLEYLTGADDDSHVRQHLLHPRVGLRCLLPPRPRPDVRAPRMVAEFDMPTGMPGSSSWSTRPTMGRDLRGPRPRLRSARHDRRRAAHVGRDGHRPRAGERRQGRQRRLVDEPDAPDQVSRRDRADGRRLPHRRLGHGCRHLRHRRRRRRAGARRGARQPAPPRRLARRLLRHRRVGDGSVDARDASDRETSARMQRATVCPSTSAPSSTDTAPTSGARWRSASRTTSTSGSTTR